MNKFYKTSYPKVSSINQIIKSKKQAKRETFRKEDLLSNNHQEAFRQTLSHEFKARQKFHIDNKIQIDPDLLFNRNCAQNTVAKKNNREATERFMTSDDRNRSISKKDRKSVFEQMEKRKQQNKTESKFYQAEEQGKALSKLRPQSKQETRTRILSAKPNIRNQPIRPQTSKGSRTNINKDRTHNTTVDEDGQFDIAISKNRNSSKKSQKKRDQNGVRQSAQGKRYNFQTSIDDQFLSLFAN